jgi:hypothetical protein
MAGGGQNRPADCLQFHLATSAYLGEAFLLFLVHCNRPFVGPVYEFILALVSNARNGSQPVPRNFVSHVRIAAKTDTRIAADLGLRRACDGTQPKPAALPYGGRNGLA